MIPIAGEEDRKRNWKKVKVGEVSISLWRITLLADAETWR